MIHVVNVLNTITCAQWIRHRARRTNTREKARLTSMVKRLSGGSGVCFGWGAGFLHVRVECHEGVCVCTGAWADRPVSWLTIPGGLWVLARVGRHDLTGSRMQWCPWSIKVEVSWDEQPVSCMRGLTVPRGMWVGGSQVCVWGLLPPLSAGEGGRASGGVNKRLNPWVGGCSLGRDVV